MPPGHAIPADGTTCQDGMKILGFLLAGQAPLDTHGNHPLSRGRQKGRKMLKHFAPLLNSSVLLCLACFHRAEKTKKPCPLRLSSQDEKTSLPHCHLLTVYNKLVSHTHHNIMESLYQQYSVWFYRVVILALKKLQVLQHLGDVRIELFLHGGIGFLTGDRQ